MEELLERAARTPTRAPRPLFSDWKTKVQRDPGLHSYDPDPDFDFVKAQERRLLARPFMAVLLCLIPRAESLVNAKAHRLRLSCRTDVASTKMQFADFDLRRRAKATSSPSEPAIRFERREDQILQLPLPYCETEKMARDDGFSKV